MKHNQSKLLVATFLGGTTQQWSTSVLTLLLLLRARSPNTGSRTSTFKY